MAPPRNHAGDPAVNSESSEPLSVTKIEAFGIKLEIPLPKWSVAALGTVLIAAALGGSAYYGITKVSNSAFVPQDQLNIYEEDTYHQTSEPEKSKEIRKETFADGTTTVEVDHFMSDGCVKVVRFNEATHSGGSRWIFGENAHTKGRHPDASLKIPEESLGNQQIEIALNSLADKNHSGADFTLAAFQGHCMDPHPGQFTYFNQPVNQCLIQVWRTFQDGCVHYQFFNPCTGSWDIYPNGAPHVTWTRCIH